MEYFDKVYSCYYSVIRTILQEAAKSPLTAGQMQELADRQGFLETAMTVVPKLTSGEWPLLKKTLANTFTPVLANSLRLPLTELQKSWLKALTSDPRFCLFFSNQERLRLEASLSGQEPLYSPEDFYYFDRFQDGDDYSDPFYQERFLIILEALRERKALWITYQGKHASSRTFEAVPYQLQYSDKDDKFRLCCLIRGRNSFNKKALLNLNRLEGCFLSSSRVPDTLEKHRFTYSSRQRTVTFEISKERNALNRCLLHFAPYEKQTIYHEKTDTYQCTLSYEIADETDLLIQLLSFGPVIRILGPEVFLRQVRQRVRRQQAASLIHPFKLPSPCCEKNPF